MAEKNRHLQVIRSKKNYASSSEAKAALATVLGTLGNGELAISTYQDSNAVDGVANILGIKAQDKKFYIDDQHILNVLGLKKPSNESGDYTLNLDNVKDVTNKLVFGEDDKKAKTIQDALNKLAAYASDLKKEALGSGAVNNIERKVSTTGVYTGASKGNPEDTDSTTTDKYIVTKKVLENNELKDKTEALTLMYTNASPADLPIPNKMGDIAKGTLAKKLNDYSISEIIDKILIPTIYPTVTNPSATISSAAGGVVEVGTAMPTPTSSLNRGKVTLDRGDGKMGDGTTSSSTGKSYVGAATTTTYTYSFSAGAANTNAGISASGTTKADNAYASGSKFQTVGTYKFKATINYAAGTAFEDSKNNKTNPMPTTNAGNVANPHAAGSVSVEGGNYTVTAPVYIGMGASTLTPTGKLPLKAWGAATWNNQNGTDLKDGANNHIVILTPRKISSLRALNPVSNKYDVNIVLDTPTTQNVSVNGVDVPYFKYVTKNNTILGSFTYELVIY